MKTLITGGAGFIGRWVVKKLLADGDEVCVLDDLSNGRIENVKEFEDNPMVTTHPCVNPIEPTEGINGDPLSAS